MRIGLGSGPGALLMTPMLMHMARHHPRLRLDIARGSTELLERGLRERTIDALVVDARSLAPETEYVYQIPTRCAARSCVGVDTRLLRRRGGLSFDQLRAYPMASTPLSDEVARVLIERYGPDAHPARCVTLRCEEVPSLVELTRQTDTVLIAVRAVGPDLMELPMKPAMNATARFAMATLAGRTEAPALPIVRQLMAQLLRDM